jgi:uncharacterized membrane protein YhfC
VLLALVIQHKMRMRRFILLSVAFLLHQISPNYLINSTIFGKKGIEHKMRVLIFSITFV